MSAPPVRSPDPTGKTGERRQLTALFYDIANSTVLLNTLDAEIYAGLQNEVHRLAAETVQKHGGFVDLMFGDGGCSYFGYPDSMEDAAEAAVRAGLEIVARCHALALPEAPASLELRVGIATGLVVLGAPSPGGGTHVQRVTGLAPTLAARVQAEAEPGSVAVASLTHAMTGALFDYLPLGMRRLKGFAEPMELWRPTAPRRADDRFSSRRRPEMPLVGREDELLLLRRRWERAREGAGQVAIVSGEAGIGKSRLVAELRRDAAEAGRAPVVLQCQPRGNSVPLHPIVEKWRRDIRDLTGDEAIGESAVRAYFAASGPALTPQAASLVLFLLRDRTEAPEAEALADAAFGESVTAVLLDFVGALCRSGPLLLVFEDTHWADSLTRYFVQRLFEFVADKPILVVCTTRAPIAAELAGDPHVLPLVLARLGLAGVRLIAQQILRETALQGRMADFLLARSDGVPLFVEELARLIETRFAGRGVREADLDRLLGETGIETLKDLLAARLADAGPARRVAQLASVLGRDFDIDGLRHLAEPQVAPADLDERLLALVAAGILVRRSAMAGAAFRFRHGLLQEAAYDSLLKAERKVLHERFARYLVAGAHRGTAAEIVAWHCEQAGMAREAADYAIRAAEACAMRSAPQEAANLLAAAERHLRQCPAEPEIAALRLRLLSCRGPVVFALAGPGSPEAAAVYEQGMQLAETRPHEEREHWFPLYWGWWLTGRDWATMLDRARTILREFEQASDRETRLQVFHCAWATQFHSGKHAECLACIDKGLALYDPAGAAEGRARFGGHDAKVCGLAERALSLWFVGQDAAAVAAIEAAIAWAETIDHKLSLCHALDFGLNLHRYRHDVGRVAAMAERLRTFADAHGLISGSVKAAIFGGWARALGGAPEEGLAEFEAGLKRQREIGTEEDLPVYYDMLAEVLGLCGRQREGLARIDEAIASAQATNDVFWLPALHRRRALLGEAIGAPRDGILADLRHALAAAGRYEAATIADAVVGDLARIGLAGGAA